MKRLVAFAITSGISVAACDPGPPREPVVVYISAGQKARLSEEFSRFTQETRIPITLTIGDSNAQTDNVISNRGTPAADVLVTDNVADIWRAADRGALRPLPGEVLEYVPTNLRDPDGFWSAVDIRPTIIGVPGGMETAAVKGYSDLAKSDYREKVCLSSPALSVNRSLMGMLIEDLGLKPAERIVRAWVRNLAAPPFLTEAELLDAIRSGVCRYGIFSGSIEAGDITSFNPEPLYYDIGGIGVARHAENAEAAQRLVDWLLQTQSLQEPASSNGKNIGLAGWRDEDVARLADRAGYR